jgi:hypothetical protein
MSQRLNRTATGDEDIEAVTAAAREHSHPLTAAADLDPLVNAISDSQYVLLGEASHGRRSSIAGAPVSPHDYSANTIFRSLPSKVIGRIATM